MTIPNNELLSLIFNILLWVITAVGVLAFFWSAIAPYTKLTKKFIGAFDCGDSWDLIGVYGISEEHIMRKIRRLHNKGIILEPRWGIDRMVDKFPDHCTHLY